MSNNLIKYKALQNTPRFIIIIILLNKFIRGTEMASYYGPKLYNTHINIKLYRYLTEMPSGG